MEERKSKIEWEKDIYLPDSLLKERLLRKGSYVPTEGEPSCGYAIWNIAGNGEDQSSLELA